MGKEAVQFMNRLGHIAAESGRIPKGAFGRWAMQLLSVKVQKVNAEMHRWSGLVISHEQRVHFDAGFAVPVLMSYWTWGVASGCVGCAVRLYGLESDDDWLVAWALYECVLFRSSTSWPLLFILL